MLKSKINKMSSSILKLSSKGQIVIPKEMRQLLPSNALLIEYDEQKQHMTLSPVKNSVDVGGSLQHYVKTYIALEDARVIVKTKTKNESRYLCA